MYIIICLADNNSRDLWKEIKKIKPQHKTRPPHIDEFSRPELVAEHFGHKYETLYNSVPSNLASVKQKINNLMSEDLAAEFQLDERIIHTAIQKLKSEKLDGDKGLCSNLVINAPTSWRLVLKSLIECMIVHGHYARELLLSTLCSLPKNKLGDVCNSDNYRGIALTCCINKVLDWVILLKYANYLKTSNLQFAYKERHSTAMCTLALKEVAKYYTSRRGRVYCCLLDATKAFDRVRFDKLFEILIERNVPACIIRILIDMYTRQTVRTVWEGCVSDEFSANNGVRQGGVLWPVLFTLYIDVLLNRLEQSGLGCYVAHEYFGALCSADDLALLAPNFACLKSMIHICESFAQEFDLLFNAKKTVCILFSGRTRHSGDPPPLYMNNVVLKWTKSAKHLGSIVTYDLKENEEINHKRNDFIGRANSVISNFKHVDKNVSSRVFMSQCCHLFGSQAWLLDSQCIKIFSTTWRKAIRKLWCLPNTTRSNIVPYLVGAPPLEEQLFRRVAKMYNAIRQGFNSKLLLLLDISVCSSKMGIMGVNTKLISSKWYCGYEHLQCNRSIYHPEAAARASAIKELQNSNLSGFSNDEITDIIADIACFWA